ncbi:hypothetical protein FDH01_gp091 [Acinetobacter phage vB_AbaM_ME3]|uniref:Uncharacterized protein n=1 Tax=Acinetobacter phage vB_AbaM_ME3 TaxID=1837876 RepID=A0A172Q071_9CAUD|nr:hypothetical protein FDH01_gp091 [Acinetobacter phage vB_AbaM_ME3]AND75252.1 hypothetical protein ME3_91 [Acinetobacter phage vB_AbaM_ME3]
MINEDKVIHTISTIEETLFESLNDTEKLLILSNLLLTISTNYLPKELQENKVNLVSNGKAVSYELLKHIDSFGLNIAMKAHHIIDLANRINDE